jgi:hypothetical protein
MATLAERWGGPLLETPDWKSLIAETLDEPSYCQDINAYFSLVQLTGATTASPPETATSASITDPTLEQLLGRKAFELLTNLDDVLERYRKAVKSLESSGFSLIGAVAMDGGLAQSRRTVLDVYEDSAIPPEIQFIVAELEQSILCNLALASAILRNQPIAHKRAHWFLKTTIEGLQNHLRLVASVAPGSMLPASIVPLAERHPVDYWIRQHHEFRSGIREMRDEMLRLGLDRYIPFQIPEDDEDE